MTEILQTSIATTVGRIVLVQRGDALVSVAWDEQSTARDDSPLLHECARQLKAYFNGGLKKFDLPLGYHCSDFQRDVCDAMLNIEYGTTSTYGALAETMNSSAQAIGNACGGNPIPIIVPCHRVLAAQGLGGFSGGGGIETKISLLKMEQAVPWLI